MLGRHQTTVWRFTPCGELAWNVKALVLLNIGSGDGAGAVVWILSRLSFVTFLYSS